jgi:NADPH2:quinone reductase
VRAVLIREFGGPEVLELAELDEPKAAPDEALIAVKLAGVNFADTHRRTGSYIGGATLPLIPGSEVVGVRTDTGERVVAYCGSGGYAERVAVPLERVFPVPDGVDDLSALALLVQGCTAWHLYNTSAPVRAGETVVVHSALGGVGSLALQLARPFGAGRVIATASNAEKLALARELLGADAAILGHAEGLTERLLEANGGRPVDVIFDVAGGAVFDASRAALARFGRIVTYGISSGEPNELRTSHLLRNSHTIASFWLTNCLEHPEMLAEAVTDLFERVGAGTLKVISGGIYPLKQAARAHIDLAARQTTGKLAVDVTR